MRGARFRIWPLGALLIGTGLGAGAADAAEKNSRQAVETLVVTAQKREANLIDTPVAVSVLGGETLDLTQSRDVVSLQEFVPSLRVEQRSRPGITEFQIRGIQTSADAIGLEPSVGVFVDGVYRARQGAAINDFLGLERVEVLRGPQSTLFGRNSSAGVVHFISARPSFDWLAEGEVTAGNFDQVVVKGAVSGPLLGDVAALRLDGVFHRRDGFFENTVTGEDLNDRDRINLRGQLLFNLGPDADFRLIGDYGKVDEACCAAPFTEQLPVNAGALAFLGAAPVDPDPFAREVALDEPVGSELTTSGVSGELSWDLGGVTLNAITAHRWFSDVNAIDADFTDLELSQGLSQDNSYTTFTQEIRLTSERGGRFDWMGGFFYYDNDLTADNTVLFGEALRPFADLATGNAISGLENILALAGLAQPGSFLAGGQGLVERFDLTTESWAVFGQVDVYLTDRLTLTGGLRYGQEDKRVAADIAIDDPFAALDLSNLEVLALLPPPDVVPGSPGPLPVDAFLPLVPFQFNPPADSFRDTRSEDNVGFNTILSYDWSDRLSTYVSYAEGYKPGGFNTSASASRTGVFQFEDERTKSYEAGLKTVLWDGRAAVNLAYFDQRVEDFQANSFTGTTFTLANAGALDIDGLEFESQLRPLDGLTLTGTLTWLTTAEYDVFTNAPCPPLDMRPTCLIDGVQDLSGENIAFVSPLTAAVTGAYTFPLIERFDGFVQGSVYYVDGLDLGSDLDPAKFQPAYATVDASIGVQTKSGQTQLQFWVQNAFDAEYLTAEFDSVGQPGSLNGFPGPPRTFGATLRVRY